MYCQLEEQETRGCVIYSDRVEPVQRSTHDSSGGWVRARNTLLSVFARGKSANTGKKETCIRTRGR